MSIADFRNLADVVILVGADIVVPVNLSCVGVDVDDKARLEVGGRARFIVVAPPAERVAGDRRPRRPVLTVPHPLPIRSTVHARSPERLATWPSHTTIGNNH